MYSSFEQRARQRGAYTIQEFENTHGRPGKSRTPISGYNPKKAMKQAEKAYLESMGIHKKSLFQRIKWLFIS